MHISHVLVVFIRSVVVWSEVDAQMSILSECIIAGVVYTRMCTVTVQCTP